MKKRLGLVIIILVVLIVIIVGFLFLGGKKISKEEALEIAYSYADVRESEVTLKKISMDYSDMEYEIEFYDEYYEYEIDVNYNNGNINNFEKDAINGYIEMSTSVSITEDEAKTIALEQAGKLESEVTFTKLSIAKDDGVTVYKVYFYDNKKEYEVYIDIETKKVVKYTEDYLEVENSADSYIGVAKAKELVLEHAGVNDADVIWHEAKLDIEYTTAIYELEFYYNNIKYEYEVNAFTGVIISYEMDRY